MSIDKIELAEPPAFLAGTAVFETLTPVVVKGDASGRFLLPADAGYVTALERNATKKANALGLPDDVRVEILDSGPQRLLQVEGRPRVGVRLRAQVLAAPQTLAVLWAWGLGEKSSEGFGWVA